MRNTGPQATSCLSRQLISVIQWILSQHLSILLVRPLNLLIKLMKPLLYLPWWNHTRNEVTVNNLKLQDYSKTPLGQIRSQDSTLKGHIRTHVKVYGLQEHLPPLASTEQTQLHLRVHSCMACMATLLCFILRPTWSSHISWCMLSKIYYQTSSFQIILISWLFP